MADAAVDADALAEAVALALAVATGVIEALGALVALGALTDPVPAGATEADVEDADDPSGSRPRSRGLRQMITAMPQAVTSTSIAMKATSFCFADGPRGRITIVGVLPRRMLPAGRSGMRIVMCPAPRGCTGNACGVNGCDAAWGPELGCPGAMPCGPDGCCAVGTCGFDPGGRAPPWNGGGTGGFIGIVMFGGAVGTVSVSIATMTAGAFRSSTGARVGGMVRGRADAYVALLCPDDSPTPFTAA